MVGKISIKTNGSMAQIFVDGHQLKGVRGYTLTHSVEGAPILTVDLLALDLSVDCPMLKLRQLGMDGEIEKIVFKKKTPDGTEVEDTINFSFEDSK